MKLIIGLGNPEDKYANTRHNLGFEVVDEFLKKINAPKWKNDNSFKAETSLINYPAESEVRIILAKPQTYMNNSGMAVVKLINYFKINLEDLIVIYDELDLPLGHIKVRKGGSAAGHHGVESIIESIHTDQFVRIRLGIGNLRTASAERGEHHLNSEHYVLEPFKSKEKSDVRKMMKHAIKALELLITEGLEKTQQQFN